jgi:hypothetical protein
MEETIYTRRRSSMARQGADVVCFPANHGLTEWQPMDDGTNGRRRGTTAKEPCFAVFPSAALALHWLSLGCECTLVYVSVCVCNWVSQKKNVRKSSMHVSILSKFSVLHSEALVLSYWKRLLLPCETCPSFLSNVFQRYDNYDITKQ